MSNLANVYRPKKFSELVGQESEIQVLRKLLENRWTPSAILVGGPYGTGKTTLTRLIARALLCEGTTREGVEPCGTCPSCLSIDTDNHSEYKEIDAASHGQVADVRSMKDDLTYRGMGKLKIVAYDEAHVLTSAAQDAMLKMLEEGVTGVLFLFATTEASEMLATIRSRCIELKLKLLTAGEIATRLKQVCEMEQIQYEERALRVLSTYVRGHMRDALVLLTQLQKMGGAVTEDAVRMYLRLDRVVEIYELLNEKDKKVGILKLEALLCNYSATELVDMIGQILLNVYKVKIGISEFSQVDEGWLRKLGSVLPENLLDRAERILSINTDFASIHYATAAIGAQLFEEKTETRANGLPSSTAIPSSMMLRKPKSEAPIS